MVAVMLGKDISMKKLPLAKAVGHALAHDLTQIAGNTKGPRFVRGHILREEDIPVLLDMGKHHIFVGEVPPGQVHEEEAGAVGAKVLAGENIAISPPKEGRFALSATQKGVLCVNGKALNALNATPDYTGVTLPNYTVCQVGQTVAGVRIVPLTTDVVNTQKVENLESVYGKILHIKAFTGKKVGIVITGEEIFSGRIPDAFEGVLREKLSAFDATVLGATICPDNVEAIKTAATAFLDQGADIIFFTGGMSVDPDDLTPTAIGALGGNVISHGVPIQPGNMLLLAYLGNVALLGLPGAVMHHKTTALDVLLPRVFADIAISKEDISQMGEGGLCLFCDLCHYPVCYFGKGGAPCS